MAQIALPHQLTNGTVADASQVMANFNAIVDVVNGNLGSDNLGSISGADVTVNDLNGGTAILNNFTERFQAGTTTFTNIPSGERVHQKITFPKSFPGAPLMWVTANAGSPDNVFVSYSEATSTGATIALTNEYVTTRTITVTWLAIYTGAMS